MAREKPRFVFSVHFFAESPNASWSLKLMQRKKELQALADGKFTYDLDLVKKAKEWEAAGAEVIASRYKDGNWSEYKPWLWYKRFQRAMKQ